MTGRCAPTSWDLGLVLAVAVGVVVVVVVVVVVLVVVIVVDQVLVVVLGALLLLVVIVVVSRTTGFHGIAVPQVPRDFELDDYHDEDSTEY